MMIIVRTCFVILSLLPITDGFQPLFNNNSHHAFSKSVSTSTSSSSEELRGKSKTAFQNQPKHQHNIITYRFQSTSTQKSYAKGDTHHDNEDTDTNENEFLEEPPTSMFPDETNLSRPELENLTVTQLKQQLRLRGMKVGGKKMELIARLLGNTYDYDDDDSESESDEIFVEPEMVGADEEQAKKSKAREFAKAKGKELIDVTDFLEEGDKGKETKSSSSTDENEKDGGDSDADFNKSKSPETWGDEARIIDDYEGRSVIVDSLSRTVVEFKGSANSKVQAYVVASRDSLKTFLAGGDRAGNSTDLETAVKNIQLTREKANKVPMRLEDVQGEDVDDEEGHYTKVLDRDYGDWGSYTMTGVQLSSQEVKGVLLLSDVYGPFSEDTKMLAEKIAFECQPVVVFAPDLFKGNPWKEEGSEGSTGLNEKGQTYEEWRAGHDEREVSVNIRAAAAALREQYGVSSVSLFGQCYGGGRALEATARSYPGDTMDDVNGELGPPHVNPSTCIAWYPTRYDAETLFGEGRKRTDERKLGSTAVMAIFAEEDVIPGATQGDAEKLKKCIESDNRVNDHMVKVFPGQRHGFAHIGISNPDAGEKDEFIDGEFGGSGSLAMDFGDAEVACLLSTAWMETYSRVFLPTTGEAVKEDVTWSGIDMPDLSESRTRQVRDEIDEALEKHQDVEVDVNRMHPDDFGSAFDDLDPTVQKAQSFGVSLEDDPDTFLDKLEAAIDREDVDFVPGFGEIPLDESADLGKAYW